jgi:hypothetical protein
MKVQQEYLKYQFTEPELKERATQLARECRELEDIENEKKQVMSDFKAKIDGHQAKISGLSNNINNGYEYRYIDCEVVLNQPIDGEKQIIRKDTGELVKQEAMTPQELQEELPLEETKILAHDFKKDMQDVVDKGNLESISISSPSFNDGKEVVIAKKKK